MKPIMRVCPDKAALDRAAARLIVKFLTEAHAARRAPVALALAGGGTPRGVYELLASPEFSALVPWSEVDVYWTDERCVPPEHPDSNYGMAERALLSKVPVSPARVHRIQGELGPEKAALLYDAELRRLGRGCDAAVLGVGADGHTASLFPGDAALEERTAWAAAASSPGGPRVTMTFPYLNLAERVLVLASGAEKAKPVDAATRGAFGAYPVLRLIPKTPALWLVDQEAADLSR